MRSVNASAPIVPNTGLGGFELRRNIRDYEGIIGCYFFRDMLRLTLGDPSHASYTFAGSGVGVDVDVRNGKTFRIVAHEGYESALFGKIRVGMNAGDAMRHSPHLCWDEAEGEIHSRTERGVYLDVGGVIFPDEVPKMSIRFIAVYAPETRETLRGASGDW
jgi:hypothetical protein